MSRKLFFIFYFFFRVKRGRENRILFGESLLRDDIVYLLRVVRKGAESE